MVRGLLPAKPRKPDILDGLAAVARSVPAVLPAAIKTTVFVVGLRAAGDLKRRLPGAAQLLLDEVGRRLG